MKKFALTIIMLFCAGAFAQNLPNAAAGKNKDTVAVYVTGVQPIGEAQGAPNVMGGEMETALSRSKNFVAVNRTDDILGVLNKEHGYTRSGAVNDAQIKKIGNQLGVQYLCIVRISVSGRGYYVEASLVDVEGARIISKSTAASRLEGYNEQMAIAQKLARELTGVDLGTVQQTTPVQPIQETKPAPPVQPVQPIQEAKPAPPVQPVQPAQEARPASPIQPVQPTPEPKPEKPKPSNIPTTLTSRNYDHYFTLRYLPIASPIYWSLPANNTETGCVWRNGMFWGFDLGVVIDAHNNNEHVGCGLNIGKSFELAHYFNFALGGSLGLWYWHDSYYDGDNNDPNWYEGINWIGPFVRLRYRIFELSYRGLFGESTTKPPYTLVYSNQLGVGLYFEGKKRHR